MLGSTVLYHVSNGVSYPAIVTAVWPVPDGLPNLNLQVFLDGPNAVDHGFSVDDAAQGLAWKSTVSAGEGVGFWSPLPDQPYPGGDPDGDVWGWGPAGGGQNHPPAVHGETANAYEHRTGQAWPWPDSPTHRWFEEERGQAPDSPTGNGCIVPADFDFEGWPEGESPCSLPPQN